MLTVLLTVALADGPAFTQLATGEDFTCGRTEDGRVFCWGNNEDQQLGLSKAKLERSAAPVDVGFSGVVDLAASAVQGCAVFQTGEVKCWGQVESASWGTGVLPRARGPGAASEVSAGPGRGCSRVKGGGAACWEELGTDPPDTRVLPVIHEVAVGAAHACARTSGGEVWCWGDDRKGQLGNEKPGWPSSPAPVDGLVNVTDIAAGEYNTCAVTRAGKVFCWGPNADGNLGTGNTDAIWGPREVLGLSSAVEVTVGRREACARTVDRKVWCWGADPCPRPDVPTRRLQPVDIGISGAEALSEGSLSDHRCALVKGQPVCWGFNSHGQAGPLEQKCVARP